MFKSWKYGNQNEPAEDFDGDYDTMYYGSSTVVNDTDGVKNGSSDEALYTDGYDMVDVSDVHIVSEKELETVSEVVEEETPEPLYKVTFYPESYVDSKDIVDAFMRGRVVVIEVAELDKENFLRMFDYVMGAIQALGGETCERTECCAFRLQSGRPDQYKGRHK